jgi:epsin
MLEQLVGIPQGPFTCQKLTCSLVRSSAKELTSLILDEERLRSERQNRGQWKSRVVGLNTETDPDGIVPGESARRKERRQPAAGDENDLEYRLALEASKNEAEAEAARRAKSSHGQETDDDLAKAIKLSKEEEELRKRQLQDQQGDLLFDNSPAQAPQPTGFNQGYQQQAAVDWYGNPMQQQQSQPTGYLNNAYSQPTGLQPQQTGFQDGYGNGMYGQQQFLQPQPTHNPWAQQATGYGQVGQQQKQPLQDQLTAQPGSNNPWASNNGATQPMQAQPTGSNNPFAARPPQQQSSPFKAPTLSTLQEQQTAQQFNNRPNPIQNFSTPVQQQPQAQPLQAQQPQVKAQDPYAARLNNLLATGEGQDTFGNIGDLRIPSQHTAPGTFVNSAGAGSMGRLEALRTGNNPFYSQAPQQYPAQTGPATGLGGNNPFGSRPPQQQQGAQGNSLIDL